MWYYLIKVRDDRSNLNTKEKRKRKMMFWYVFEDGFRIHAEALNRDALMALMVDHGVLEYKLPA